MGSVIVLQLTVFWGWKIAENDCDLDLDKCIYSIFGMDWCFWLLQAFFFSSFFLFYTLYGEIVFIFMSVMYD